VTAHCSHLNRRDSGEGKIPFTALASVISPSQIGQITLGESASMTTPQKVETDIG
jgi:hypothetical protein